MNGAVNASFVYGAFGRRASKTINGTATAFLYDGLNPVHELQGDSPTANILTGLGIDEYFQRIDSNGASNLPIDALESTLALADSTGTIQTSYTYEPFGNTTVSGALSTNPFQFTGRENDGTGLYYYRARYYGPTFQRFVSQDPLDIPGGGDANLYAYASNQPTDLRDPTGMQAEGVCEMDPELCNELGQLITDIITAGVGAVSELCRGNRKQKCDEQYNNDIAICRTLPDSGARSRCYNSAINQKGRCEQGWDPLPPLITW